MRWGVLFFFCSCSPSYLKDKLSLERRPGGVAGGEWEGTASRTGCFQGANLSISSQLVRGRGRDPSPVAAAATAVWSLLLEVGVCLKGVASILSPSHPLFNWPSCISAAEPSLALPLSSLGSLPVFKKRKFLATCSLDSTLALCLTGNPECV